MSAQPSPRIEVSQAQGDVIDMVWVQLQEPIRRALRHGAGSRTNEQKLRSKLKLGQAHMWVVHEADRLLGAVVVSVCSYPVRQVVCVDLVAGVEADRWQSMVEDLLADFRDLIGADSVEAYCRKGLVKKLSGDRKSVV